MALNFATNHYSIFNKFGQGFKHQSFITLVGIYASDGSIARMVSTKVETCNGVEERGEDIAQPVRW
jgi:hypothetical protein